MAASFLIIVFFLVPHPSDATLKGFEAATLQILGEDNRVTTVLGRREMDDAAVLLEGGEADGIVQVRWGELDNSVTLRIYFALQRRWVERHIDFEARDPDYDQGRLLGLVVASMFMGLPAEEDPPRLDAAVPDAQTPSDTSKGKPPADTAAPGDIRDQSTGLESAATSPQPRSGAAGESPNRRALEFSALGTTGLDGGGNNVGARAGLRWQWGPRLYVRSAFAFRGGAIPKAEATMNSGMLSAGVGVQLLSPNIPLELDLRTDVLGGWLAVTHFSEDDPAPVRKMREHFGADLLVVLAFQLSKSVGVFTSGGIEMMLGATDLYTHGQWVATIPAVDAVAELGLRAGF